MVSNCSIQFITFSPGHYTAGSQQVIFAFTCWLYRLASSRMIALWAFFSSSVESNDHCGYISALRFLFFCSIWSQADFTSSIVSRPYFRCTFTEPGACLLSLQILGNAQFQAAHFCIKNQAAHISYTLFGNETYVNLTWGQHAYFIDMARPIPSPINSVISVARPSEAGIEGINNFNSHKPLRTLGVNIGAGIRGRASTTYSGSRQKIQRLLSVGGEKLSPVNVFSFALWDTSRTVALPSWLGRRPRDSRDAAW